MSCELLVRMKIPMKSNIIFSRWLPLEAHENLQTEAEGLKLSLWFDMSCLQHIENVEKSEIPRCINLKVGAVWVDVTIKEISDELAEFIYRESDRPTLGKSEQATDPSYISLREQYLALGEQVLAAAVNAVNRLMIYARNAKGQYWVEERILDLNLIGSSFTEFDARVKSERFDWVRWFPSVQDSLVLREIEQSRYLTQGEWKEVQAFVDSTQRIDLVLQLLANSEKLLENGYPRSAVIEVVSALEVAIHHFARNLDPDKIRSSIELGRINLPALSKQIVHLGFSGSLQYLIPILLDESQLSFSLLSEAWKALEARNNIVHNGQRDVDKNKALTMIRAIRDVCTILLSFCRP